MSAVYLPLGALPAGWYWLACSSSVLGGPDLEPICLVWVYCLAICFVWRWSGRSISARLYLITWNHVELGQSYFKTRVTTWRYSWIVLSNWIVRVLVWA